MIVKNSKVVVGVTTLHYAKRAVDCLLNLVAYGEIAGWCIPDACLIPQSRNAALELAYKNFPDFSHFIFIDDDMCGFGPQHVWKLWKNCEDIDDCDIVSALVTSRKPPYKIIANILPSVVDGDDKLLEAIKEKCILETIRVGMAFTMIKRQVLDQLFEITEEDERIWFTTDRRPRLTFPEEQEEYIKGLQRSDLPLELKLKTAIEYGQVSHIGTQLIGEDYAFCDKARKAGFKIFIDCGVPVGHIGDVTLDFRHAFLNVKGESNSTKLVQEK